MLWGDGSPTREFLYVDDAAEGIVAAAARYDEREPVNLGSGQESEQDAANLRQKVEPWRAVDAQHVAGEYPGGDLDDRDGKSRLDRDQAGDKNEQRE